MMNTVGAAQVEGSVLRPEPSTLHMFTYLILTTVLGGRQYLFYTTHSHFIDAEAEA